MAIRRTPANAILPDSDFLQEFKLLGPKSMAKKYGCSERGIYERRARLEKRAGVRIDAPIPSKVFRGDFGAAKVPGKVEIRVYDGIAIIGSDAHYWPGKPSAAHRALVKFCKSTKPKVIIKNGDVLDGASISRYQPIGWTEKPSVIEEIEACQDRLGEITKAALGARRFWPLGNHDMRFDTRLAHVAPEYARVNGMHLIDHFPDWEMCWIVQINDDVIVKHRHKGGIHATHNNTLWSGKTIITGHLHSLRVTPFSDYNGTRYGVDCGTMASPYGPQFADYTELNPVNWRSGFVVLTFRGGKLMWPEIVSVVNEEDGVIDFRGELIEV